jgi:hypothetical protein
LHLFEKTGTVENSGSCWLPAASGQIQQRLNTGVTSRAWCRRFLLQFLSAPVRALRTPDTIDTGLVGPPSLPATNWHTAPMQSSALGIDVHPFVPMALADDKTFTH